MTSKDGRPKHMDPSADVLSTSFANSGQTLRQQAEEILRNKVDEITEGQEALSFEEARQMFHELQVHQIELEMQNEELRRTHAELDIVRERYFDLYNLAPVGYCTLCEKGLIVEANLAAAAMLDTARSGLARQPISRFIFKEDQDIYYFHRKNLFESGEPQTCELRMVKNDGALFWTTLVSTSAKEADGVLSCRILMIDITECKQAQEESARLEIQLKKAQRMKSVGRLAGGVAHGFNNMLGVILGYTEMALGQLGSTHPLYVDLLEVRKAAERSADLTRQLLAFASEQIIAPKILNLNQVVENVIKVLLSAISEKKQFSWQPGTDLWPISMDPVQIGQMLANLCENARDAIAGNATGEITISTGNTTLDEVYCASKYWLIPGDYVQLTVSDNGCGMDQGLLDDLFEPFFTTKGMYTSSGLGLATVYGAVKQNNGFIEVTSEPGHGTTIIIYFPRHSCEARKIPTKNSVQPVTPSQQTILVVEDEPIVLELVTKLLELIGFNVFATNDVHEAIRLAQQHAGNIDLLLTDVLMPEMNGDELAQKILADDPSLKCLFMSGYTADIITRRGGLLVKDIHFIQKPFTVSSLTVKIQEVLAQPKNI